MFTRSRSVGVAGGLLTFVLLSACAGGATPGGATGTPTAASTPTTVPSMPTSPTTAPSAPGSPTTSASAGETADATALRLKMADSPLGDILVDGNGMTLYLFTKDSPNTSACEGQCLVAWPPLIGDPQVGEGVDDSKLGSFRRSDGRTQASYNGWPLYYWQNDAQPGDATGQNVNGVWFVLDRDGDAVKG